MKRFGLILAFALINFGALALGGWLMGEGPASAWYQELNKAPWTPPGWVFGMAWTLIMICYSIYLGFLFFSESNSAALWWLYAAQLGTNISWNYLFFNLHWMFVALVVLLILTSLIWLMFFKYRPRMKAASLMLAPYMIWLLIASSLNIYAWLMN